MLELGDHGHLRAGLLSRACADSSYGGMAALHSASFACDTGVLSNEGALFRAPTASGNERMGSAPRRGEARKHEVIERGWTSHNLLSLLPNTFSGQGW